jgi:DNA-binding response OmpR family regulator
VIGSPVPIVFVIDGEENILRPVEEATSDVELSVLGFAELVTAKRRLLQETPALIICNVTVEGDEEAGFRLCEELQGHSLYKGIPVLLVAEHLTDEAIRQASASGARGLMPAPLQVSSLRARIAAIVPLRPRPPKPDEESVPTKEDIPAEESASEDGDMERNFHVAQNLLAKVLHNLKTSDLLKIAEEEDVPRVVFEITRSVCGIRGASAETKSGDTSVDLDKAFGRKTS